MLPAYNAATVEQIFHSLCGKSPERFWVMGKDMKRPEQPYRSKAYSDPSAKRSSAKRKGKLFLQNVAFVQNKPHFAGNGLPFPQICISFVSA